MFYLKIQPTSITGIKLPKGKESVDLPLIAIDIENGGKVKAIGYGCTELLNQESQGIYVCNPFETLELIMADFILCEAIIRWFIKTHLITKFMFFPPKAVVQLVGYGRELNEGENHVINRLLINAGFRDVTIASGQEPLSLEELLDVRTSLKYPWKLKQEEVVNPSIPNSHIKTW